MAIIILSCALAAAIILCAAFTLKYVILRHGIKHMCERIDFVTQNETNLKIDLSHDKTLNKSIESWNTALENLRIKESELRLMSRELTESITNISHDLRTPLAAITGYIQLMQTQRLSGKSEEYLNIINERCFAMRGLTEELFSYTLTANSPKFEIKAVDINSILENSLTQFYQNITDAKLNVNVEISPEPFVKKVCPQHIERIFGNLITNAVKYSGGDLIVKSYGGTVNFTNRAPNLSTVEAGKLFDRFFTVQSANNKSAGLGLSIAQMLARRNNITINSNLSDGNLTITLTF